MAERIVLETYNEAFSKFPRGGKVSNEALTDSLVLFFRLGSEWQQEQNKNLYSEEDLLNFGAFVRIEDKKEKRLFLIQDYYKKWIEQFSKLKNG